MIITILWNKAVACTVTMCQTADGTAILKSASFIQLQEQRKQVQKQNRCSNFQTFSLT